MNDLITLLVFALIIWGFGFACTMGAKPTDIRVAAGAILMVSGALLAVGSIVFSLMSIAILVWG